MRVPAGRGWPSGADDTRCASVGAMEVLRPRALDVLDSLRFSPDKRAKAAPKVPETGDSDLGSIAAALAVLGAAALAGVTGIRFSSDRR